MTVSLTRRALFQGRISRPGPQPIRPPWAVPANAFLDLCSRCDACLKACDSGILVRGDGGYPVADFRNGACTFCAACANACDTGAIRAPNAGGAPWRAKAAIGSNCLSAAGVTCRVCGDHCDARAIRFRLAVGGGAHPEIQHNACTGCGACVAPCPAGAVTVAYVREEDAA